MVCFAVEIIVAGIVDAGCPTNAPNPAVIMNWGHWAEVGKAHVGEAGCEYPKVVAWAEVGIGYTFREMAYCTLFVVIFAK